MAFSAKTRVHLKIAEDREKTDGFHQHVNLPVRSKTGFLYYEFMNLLSDRLHHLKWVMFQKDGVKRKSCAYIYIGHARLASIR